MILLNGKRIPGYNQKMSASLTLAGEDMSGNSSATTQAETGDKPKELNISTLIKFVDTKDLTALQDMAMAKNGSDERMVYTIVNPTANALKIRQVVFQGDFNVREDESNLQQWQVSFKLVEQGSIPEKTQQRAQLAKKKAVTVQKPAGVKVAKVAATGATPAAPTAVQSTPATPAATAPSEPAKLSTFETILKKADELAGMVVN